MKILFLLLLFSLKILAQKPVSLGNKQNPLYSIVFYDLAEVAQFKNYNYGGGSVVGEKDKSGDYKFGVTQLSNGNKTIVVFEHFAGHKKNKDGSSSPKRRILDTITIVVKKNEYINTIRCRQDTLINNCLIALVIDENGKQYHDKVIKAWFLNTKTGKIMELKNTKGINCLNESFDLIEQTPIPHEQKK